MHRQVPEVSLDLPCQPQDVGPGRSEPQIPAETGRPSYVYVPCAHVLAFALGGALIAISGVLVSTFSTVSAGIGIQYTLKALIIVIVGGPGRMGGALAAGILLGVAETVALQFVSGLALAINYAILILVLLIRPEGLFASG